MTASRNVSVLLCIASACACVAVPNTTLKRDPIMFTEPRLSRQGSCVAAAWVSIQDVVKENIQILKQSVKFTIKLRKFACLFLIEAIICAQHSTKEQPSDLSPALTGPAHPLPVG